MHVRIYIVSSHDDVHHDDDGGDDDADDLSMNCSCVVASAHPRIADDNGTIGVCMYVSGGSLRIMFSREMS